MWLMTHFWNAFVLPFFGFPTSGGPQWLPVWNILHSPRWHLWSRCVLIYGSNVYCRPAIWKLSSGNWIWLININLKVMSRSYLSHNAEPPSYLPTACRIKKGISREQLHHFAWSKQGFKIGMPTFIKISEEMLKFWMVLPRCKFLCNIKVSIVELEGTWTCSLGVGTPFQQPDRTVKFGFDIVRMQISGRWNNVTKTDSKLPLALECSQAIRAIRAKEHTPPPLECSWVLLSALECPGAHWSTYYPLYVAIMYLCCTERKLHDQIKTNCLTMYMKNS